VGSAAYRACAVSWSNPLRATSATASSASTSMPGSARACRHHVPNPTENLAHRLALGCRMVA
jgi:hypothetical protein